MKGNGPLYAAYTAYAVMWVAAGAAIFGAVYVTHSGWPLWALFIPGCVSLKTSSDKE